MRVKALANGNVIDLPDETAQPLIRAGVYQAHPKTTKDMEADPKPPSDEDEDDEDEEEEPTPGEEPTEEQKAQRTRRRYKRRDMRPEP